MDSYSYYLSSVSTNYRVHRVHKFVPRAVERTTSVTPTMIFKLHIMFIFYIYVGNDSIDIAQSRLTYLRKLYKY